MQAGAENKQREKFIGGIHSQLKPSQNAQASVMFGRMYPLVAPLPLHCPSRELPTAPTHQTPCSCALAFYSVLAKLVPGFAGPWGNAQIWTPVHTPQTFSKPEFSHAVL